MRSAVAALPFVTLWGAHARAQEDGASAAGGVNVVVSSLGPGAMDAGEGDADREGGAVQVCWEHMGSLSSGDGVRVLRAEPPSSGGDTPARSAFDVVATVPDAQRCWVGRGDFQDVWAIESATSRRPTQYFVARPRALRSLGRIPLGPTIESATVLAAFRAREGTMWFGTLGGGVSRLDPRNGTWRSFGTDDGLSGNTVQAIHQDRTGALWFGTLGGGVTRYDPSDRSWRTFAAADGLGSSMVYAIDEDELGALWFATGAGVSRYQPSNRSWRVYRVEDGLVSNQVQTVFRDRAGILWFGTRDAGISRYDPEAHRWTSIGVGDGLPDEGVWCVTQDAAGAIWVGTRRGGAARLDPATGRWRTYDVGAGLPSNDVRSIYQDSNGDLWFGTGGGGVARLDATSGTWSQIGVPDGLPSNRVNAMLEERPGAIWFLTIGGGAARYDASNGKWFRVGLKPDLIAAPVRTIHQDAAGRVWFGTGGGGVSVYDPSDGSWEALRASTGLASDVVLSMFEESSGVMWFGTRAGASRYDPSSRSWRTFDHTNGLASDIVTAIGEDRHGAVWLGTWGGGASRYTSADGRWRTFMKADGLGSDVILSVYRDSVGAMWFGTMGAGAARYDPASDTWRRFSVREGMGSAAVQAIIEDSPQVFFFGTWGGVTRYDAATLSWRTYRDLGHLSSNVVRAITRDSSGHLLIGTPGGVARYVPSSDAFVEHPACPSGACGETRPTGVLALYESASGLLWIGTERGVLRLSPDGRTLQRLGRPPRDGLTDPLSVLSGVLQVPSGDLWVGGPLGLMKVNRELEMQGEDPLDPLRDLKAFMDFVDVRSMALDVSGALVVGTDRGVYGVEPETGLLLGYDPDQGPSGVPILGVLTEPSGAMSVATKGGVLRLDASGAVCSESVPVGENLETEPSGVMRYGSGCVDGSRIGIADLFCTLLRAESSRGRLDALAGEVVEDSRTWFRSFASEDDIQRAVERQGRGGRNTAELLAMARLQGLPLWAWRDDELAMIATDGTLRAFKRGARVRKMELPVSYARLLAGVGSTLCVAGYGLACSSDGVEWSPVPGLDAHVGEGDKERIEVMEGARGGGLWVATRSRLCQWDGEGTHQAQCSKGEISGAIQSVSVDTRGAWVGTAQGLFRARVEPEGMRVSPLVPPFELAVRALTQEPDSGALWIAAEGGRLFRYQPSGSQGEGGESGEFLQIGTGTPGSGRSSASGVEPVPVIDGLAVDPQGRLLLRSGALLYDYPISSRQDWFALVVVGGALLAGGAWGGARAAHPLARRIRRDSHYLRTVELAQLPGAVRRLRALAISPEDPMGGLQCLLDAGRVWHDPMARRAAVARILRMKEVRSSAHHLEGALPELGVVLPDRRTILLDSPSTAEVPLRQFIASQPLGRPVRALVLAVTSAPQELPVGAVSLSEGDIREVGWAEDPTTALTRLLWQRCDLSLFSPYQTRGPVTEPQLFFGRAVELRQILALAPTEAAPGRACLLIGPRRIGKSSLLFRARDELRVSGRTAWYGTLRREVRTSADLVRVLDPRGSSRTTDLRALASGGLLLLDEADLLLHEPGRAELFETLRALVQEGVCGVVMAGYGALHRAALSQGEVVNNFGQPLYLGALDETAASRLALEPMAAMGVTWADPALAARLVQETGRLPDLLQESCRLLLLRVRGQRAPVLDEADLDAVLAHWRPEGEPSGLRGQLVMRVESNVAGPACAFVFARAPERQAFTRSELALDLDALHFSGASERVDDVARVLVLSGICTREGDRLHWTVPLLSLAIQDLQREERIAALRVAWQRMSAEERRTVPLWSAEGTGQAR